MSFYLWPRPGTVLCANCSFRACLLAWIPPLITGLCAFVSLLCLSVSFLSGFHLFLFYLHPSLCLSGSPFIMLSYLTMSSDTSALLSASVYSHPVLPSSSFALLIPPYWPVSPCLSLSLFRFLSLSNPLLCDIARAAHTCTHTHSHSRTLIVTESHSGTARLRLAGLFELCGVALRDCVQLCPWHVWCVFMHVHTLTGMCACLHKWQRVPREVWNRGFEADEFVTGL